MPETPSPAGDPPKTLPGESKVPSPAAPSSLPPAPSDTAPPPPPPPPDSKPAQTPALSAARTSAAKSSSLLSPSIVSSNGTGTAGPTFSSSSIFAPTNIAGLTNPQGAAGSSGGEAVSSRPGLDGGAVAGIVLGAVLLGFSLGALAMFLFRRIHRRAESDTGPSTSVSYWRRSKPDCRGEAKDGAETSARQMAADKGNDGTHQRSSSASSSSSSILSPLAVVAKVASAQAVHSAASGATSEAAPDPLRLDQFLLCPAPDKTLASELQALDHLIQLHVEDHFHLDLMQPSTAVRGELQSALADLGLGRESCSPGLGQLVTLAVNPKTRYAALRHVVATAVAQSVVLSPTAKFSLLPASLSLFMKEMAPTEKDMGSPRAVSAAFTRWRQMSAFLIHPKRSDRGTLVPTEAMVGDKVKKLAAGLTRFLAPFVDPAAQKSGRQQDHLRDLLMECAKFGYLLLSQPGEFCLRQVADDSKSKGHLVVCPGLDKVGDEQGEAYSPARTLLAPATEKL